MKFSRFIKYFIFSIILFVCLNAVVWFKWVHEIVDKSNAGGDLRRIGYVNIARSYRLNTPLVTKNHIDISDYNGTPVDVITIGDSFSIGGGGGVNNYYQDWLATEYNINVLNIPSYCTQDNDNPVLTLVKLINSGFIDLVKPKFVIIETIERFAIKRLTSNFKINESTDISTFYKCKKRNIKTENNVNKFNLDFINDGNIKFILNNIQYYLKGRALYSDILIFKLNNLFFSGVNGNTLIAYKEDISNNVLSNKLSVSIANDNLNKLSDKLKSKNVKLIFMPVVNKHNLYSPYIIAQNNNNLLRHKSIFFEELRKLKKDYVFIDTKEILSEELKKRELDVFYQDDTHWNWKAAKAVVVSKEFKRIMHEGF